MIRTTTVLMAVTIAYDDERPGADDAEHLAQDEVLQQFPETIAGHTVHHVQTVAGMVDRDGCAAQVTTRYALDAIGVRR